MFQQERLSKTVLLVNGIIIFEMDSHIKTLPIISIFIYICFSCLGEMVEEPTPCGGFYECPEGTVCDLYWEGPQFGITNFDNIGRSVCNLDWANGQFFILMIN